MTPQIYTAKVMHRRLFPKANAFNYGVYYLALPLPASPIASRFASFHPRDVGRRDGSDPTPWVRDILANYGLGRKVQSITLITMPRVLGYVFNPVSFYLCTDHSQALVAVLCEVHNTFGEQHCYLCANGDGRAISPDQWLEAEKVFHVSPFLERAGHYKFRFDLNSETFGVWIDYYDAQQNKQLIPSLLGSFQPLTPRALRRTFWRHPLVTLKAILLIHWQAAKLVVKGIRYLARPAQLEPRVTPTQNLKKL